MTQMTPDRWARAPWHARQKYLDQQNRRLRDLNQRVDVMQSRADTLAAYLSEDTTASIRIRAEAILARLDVDPDAALHRADLLLANPRRSAA